MTLFVTLASIFLFPWLAGTTFGPRHAKGEVDFSALRNNAHLAARNDNKHLRDADRDDGKGGAPPDVTLHFLAFCDPHSCTESLHDTSQPAPSAERQFFYRGGLQPRAPPVVLFLTSRIA